ncbi:cyclohexanecarboxyl-CoA dehydrogenase [Lentzea atacamensis]|uniref:Cyclohexanecarboxyl-CoA dehydrogenase n=2 Tax=Lentzea atacamensis TaxID=531938 RepID=A0ABX9DXT0_9PSEU|nr:cyclohexanecarboxyl-CoA dehydrogenase [Lentzea atacamensis]
MHCSVGANLQAGVERSRRLRAIRQDLARHVDTTGDPDLFQLLTQFMCGYCDIDLRDTFGLGHGRLIARHGGAQTRQRWIPRLLAGELAGIAVTEPHGGSRPAETQTCAVAGPDGTWKVTGRKSWISRLTEAAVFVLFFRTPDGGLAAAAVDATQPGLHRQPIPPTGLAGWTWGVLDLDEVKIRQEDVLHGDGMLLLREHFAGYRPLVTATALGGAAAVFDAVTARLSARQAAGDLHRLRDSALITLGRTHVQLATALLGAVTASYLAEGGHPAAELWGAATKAHGIDTANSATAELALLLGASGFRADCRTAKTRRDLGGLLYADGIHDSLYRTAGKQHTATKDSAGDVTAVPAPRDRPASVAMTA